MELSGLDRNMDSVSVSFPLSQSLQFLSPKEVLVHVIEVNRLLFSLGLSTELWAFYIERDFGLFPLNSTKLQNLYFQLFVKTHTLKVLKPEHGQIASFYPGEGRIIWHSIQGHRTFPSYASLYPLKNGHLMIAGGYQHLRPVSDTFLLSEDTLEVSKVKQMITPRFAGGMIEVESKVYVFGGATSFAGTLQESETYDLSTDQWTALPPMMEANLSCYPLLYKSRIYIAGVKSRLVQEFDIQTQEYKLLFLMDNIYTHLAYHETGSLVWMDSFGLFTYYSPDTGNVSTRRNKFHRAELPLSCELLRYQDEVYYASKDRGRLCILKLDKSLAIRTVVTESLD